MSCIFVPAQLTHVGPIANNMREMDVIECLALGRTPRTALRNGLRCSQDAWTCLKDGRPVSMMGIVSDGLLSGSARVWFLGTDEVFKEGRVLLFYGPLFIERWLEHFEVLRNIIAVDNVKAIRLLKRWGFTVESDRERHKGVAFVPFHIRKWSGQQDSNLWPERSERPALPTELHPDPAREAGA